MHEQKSGIFHSTVRLWKYNKLVMVTALAEKGQARPYRTLGRRVQALRQAAGLTQYELADQVGISRGYPPLIEGGQNRPDAAILRRIATVLRADYSELAALAGFIETPTGDVVVYTTPEDAAYVRWFSALPGEAKRRLQQVWDAVSGYAIETRPSAAAGEETTDETADGSTESSAG